MAETGIMEIADRLRQVRVAPRPELKITRHVMGGAPHYVVFDPITLQSHKFASDDYQLLVALNDKRTLQEIFQQFVDKEQLPPSAEENFLRFVLYLHQLGLLNLPIADGTALYRRFKRRMSTGLTGRLMNILFWRVPLVQPDRFLERTSSFARPFFTRTAFALWAIGMVVSLYLVVTQWAQFTHATGNMFAVENLPALWLLLVGSKVLHELGHAYACKVFGGSVPEIGAYFILMTPCAYVDASASWGFPSRWHRMIVALAGIYVESILAMLALGYWCLQPDGMLGHLAHHAVVLSTIVTIGFNANPLMRYDGYYVLSDLVNRPNLRAESQRTFLGFFKRILFGIPHSLLSDSFAMTILHFVYGGLSLAYQQVVVLGISITLITRIPLIGLLVGGCFALFSFGGLLWHYVRYLLRSEELQDHRWRATCVTLSLAALLGILANVRLPSQFTGAGTLLRENEATIRAKVPGFLREVLVRDGETLTEGGTVCELENIPLRSQHLELLGTIDELRSLMQYHAVESPALAMQSQQKLFHQQFVAEQAARDVEGLRITCPFTGTISCEAALFGRGQYVAVGDALATVSQGDWRVRLLVQEEEISKGRVVTGAAARIKVAGWPQVTFPGHVSRVAPQRAAEPAPELISVGQDAVTSLPTSTTSVLYEVEVEIDVPPAYGDAIRRGMTAWVRLESPPEAWGEAIARQIHRFWNRLAVAH